MVEAKRGGNCSSDVRNRHPIDQLALNAGQKNCRMLPLEHSAILLTFIKLPFVIKIFVLSIFEWACYTSFTVFVTGSTRRTVRILGMYIQWKSLSNFHMVEAPTGRNCSSDIRNGH